MLYSSSLLEYYSDYKTIWKNLQIIDEAFQEDPVGTKVYTSTLPADVVEYLRTFPDPDEDAAKKEVSDSHRLCHTAQLTV